MDLHVYRNSQDRWHDVRSAARERGAVLAVNAITVDELVQRITPDVQPAALGQRLVALQQALTRAEARDYNLRYVADAVSELKSARIRSGDLRSAGAVLLADLLTGYDDFLHKAKLLDPQDRRALAAARVRESAVPWLQRFDRVVLHALYDLTEAEFQLVSAIIEALPEGGAVMLFNNTTNIKPTQFAEWTWRRFIQDESLAEKTFPEFCSSAGQSRAILDKLFVFEPHEPFPADDSLRIIETSGRYKEAETVGREIADLLEHGETPNQIVVVVRHIDIYGEMLEDVFTRYGIPHAFETGVPLLRVPFIKYWLSLLDLVTSDRGREALARVMSSAYFDPRLSPGIDVEKELATMGYIDGQHLRASALAARKNSALTAELQRFENVLDDLENSHGTVTGLLSRVQPSRSLNERDRQAWRVLAEELESLESAGEMTFASFRKLASDIASLRTVDRLSAAATAPGLPRVRIMSPHSLGSRYYKWIFAPGFSDGEFPGRASSNPLLNDSTVEVGSPGTELEFAL